MTNLAHENNGIKNQVRVEGASRRSYRSWRQEGPEPRKRAAAGPLRTLAFKNDDNKNQIVECGALPMLIFMVKSEDQLIHYEAVGVIGNLVHSSTHIKRRVLDEGALQPVIVHVELCVPGIAARGTRCSGSSPPRTRSR